MGRSLVLLAAPLLFAACSSASFDVARATTRPPSSEGGVDAASGDVEVVDLGGDSDDAASDVGVDSDDAPGDGTLRDGAPMCPAPPSTASFDATALACDELVDQYANAVPNAKSCGCDADCSELVCVDLCCTCMAYVSLSTDAYRKLQAIKTEWDKRVASTKCAPLGATGCVTCAAPKPAGCHGSGPGSPKSCR